MLIFLEMWCVKLKGMEIDLQGAVIQEKTQMALLEVYGCPNQSHLKIKSVMIA